jgi:hypothetical protein
MGILKRIIGSNTASGIFKSSLKDQFTPTKLTSNVFHQLRNTKGLGQITAGIGVFKAAQAFGNELDVANERSGRGSGWGSVVKGAGALAGGGLAVTGASKMIGDQIRVFGNTFSKERWANVNRQMAAQRRIQQRGRAWDLAQRADARDKILGARAQKLIDNSNYKPSDGYERAANFIEGGPRKLLGFAGHAAGDAAVGIAAAPIAPILALKGGFANSNFIGSAMAGVGLWGGAIAGMAAGNFNDSHQPRDRAALGGTSYVDPNSGQRPRKTGLDPSLANTAGLVQSLHKLR